MKLLGQDKLINKFNSMNLDSLPHSMVFIGEEGCGKKTLCSMIASNCEIDIKFINEKINFNLIDFLNNVKQPLLCVFNSNDISLQEEAAMLKYIEEPKSNIFNIIISESKYNIIDTILNRCQVYNFDPYTKDILSKFKSNISDSELNIASTPGQILSLNDINIDDMMNFIEKIYTKIGEANIGSILAISNKIKFKSLDEQGFPINIFSKGLLYYVNNQIQLNKLDQKFYFPTLNFCNNLKLNNIDKKYLFENFLYSLKELTIV